MTVAAGSAPDLYTIHLKVCSKDQEKSELLMVWRDFWAHAQVCSSLIFTQVKEHTKIRGEAYHGDLVSSTYSYDHLN